ncbi:MAG TPA: hypothetical protein VMB03_23290 [Bryobacteraceae bacterium]|nr:hypothetical protein [Bryobacteraceae bacterium]
MKPIQIGILSLSVIFLHCAWSQTATYSNSNQNVTLTGLGGSNGVGQSSVQWGTCAFDGTNTNCTVTAPYTGVGGGGTISLVLSYAGNGKTPFLANSISPGSNLVTFGLTPGSSGSLAVSLMENTGTTVNFLTNGFTFYFATSATCSGTAVSACSVGQVGLTAGATITGPVYGTFDQTPVIRTSQGVISASAYGGFNALAPGSWMEIYGTNLANVKSQTWAAADFNGNNAPTILGQTTVTIGGKSAFIDYVSPGQVNAQVPSDVGTGSQPVVVTTPGGASVAYNITVNTTEPGLLAPGVFDLNNEQYVGAVFPGNSVVFVLPPGAISGATTQRAQPGQTIVFYGVGFGAVTPSIPAGQIVTQSNNLAGTFQIYFNGTPATVSFAGLTGGYLGLYQFNVVVPNVAASDTVPVTFSLNGVPGTQTMVIAIQ